MVFVGVVNKQKPCLYRSRYCVEGKLARASRVDEADVKTDRRAFACRTREGIQCKQYLFSARGEEKWKRGRENRQLECVFVRHFRSILVHTCGCVRSCLCIQLIGRSQSD
jgi:hypothetical protein